MHFRLLRRSALSPPHSEPLLVSSIGILQGSTAASTFNYSAYSNYGSTLNISTPAVSEVFTTVSFGLLLALGLGGLGIAARRKKSTP